MFDLALSLLRARVPSPVGDLNVGTRLWPSSEECASGAGDTGLILGSGRSPGGGDGNPLQHSFGKSHEQRSLVDYSPRGCKSWT